MTDRRRSWLMGLGLALILVPFIALNALVIYRVIPGTPEPHITPRFLLASAVLGFLVFMTGIVLLGAAFGIHRSTEAARYDSEERFRLFVQSVTDYAIYVLDPQGHVTSWNPGAERIKGYAPNEILGKHFSLFFTEEDRQAGVPGRALETAIREGKYTAEAWRVRKDGSRFMASAVIEPLRDASGRMIGFAKITRDVTERLEQQLALDLTRAALAQSQKMESLGQLSGGIAHDFNNLLHVIRNAIEVLQRRLQTADPEVRKFMDMVQRNADRAAELTRRLLAFSRLQPLEPRPTNPNRLVTGMVELLRRTLGESVVLETVLGDGLWSTLIDANQLETAMVNLAVNSRDAMPEGGKLTIETSNAFLDERYASTRNLISGQYVMIAVSDTGTGMTPEVIAKAFDPFFTTKSEGQGTGLGLSQVYGFIRQSGGHVSLYSEPGEGTTVRLYLPRYAALDAAEIEPEVSRLPLAEPKETILVVEDAEDVRNFTADVLRDLGYVVRIAPDARSALTMLEREPDVTLLFTDVGLPGGINGRQLADEAQRRWPGLRVLFTTGYTRDAIVHHGRLDPGIELISKPFNQADLARKVRRVIESTHSAA